MKQCNNVTAWTDYPFKQLGDVPNSLAPIRHVEVFYYDGNKYATVRIGDMIAAIKCGIPLQNSVQTSNINKVVQEVAGQCAETRKDEEMKDPKDCQLLTQNKEMDSYASAECPDSCYTCKYHNKCTDELDMD